MIITALLSIVFIIVSIFSIKVFANMRESTDMYILCEKSALHLQNGSDKLTEQVRLFTLTGLTKYMDAYFEEANVTRSRENSVAELGKYYADTEIFANLQEALEESKALMKREFYAMRLVADALDINESELPTEIRSIEPTQDDIILGSSEKIERARSMVSDEVYQSAKTNISNKVDHCMNSLIDETNAIQIRNENAFRILYGVLEVGLAVIVIFLIADSIIVRKLIVNPLISYNKRIQQDETIPVIGAAELQSLAETYNRVYEENHETQKIIRHEAEHDPLTDLLNKGSFDKIMSLYKSGNTPYALVLVDIDVFKSVNDTYGHSVGDKVIRAVAQTLKRSFRTMDYIFRIGGDEFAVVLVNMSVQNKPALESKLEALNKSISECTEDIPRVTLSIGAAFSDGELSTNGIFNDADEALYYVKEHGKNGYRCV